MSASKNKSLSFRTPMSAKSFEKYSRHIRYPCYIQPKVDGIRCVTDGRRFWSKNGKLFPQQNFRHLQLPRFPFLLDGELSLDNDSRAEFEDIVSAVKREGHAESSHLCFNAFDVITHEPYVDRLATLQQIFEAMQIAVISFQWSRLTTRKALNLQSLREFHRSFLERGYEGSIVRNALGLYVPKRSIDVLKWKPIQDAEFEIIDMIEAKGKDRGTPIFVCAVPSSHDTFRVRPKGSRKQRHKMWYQRNRIIGRQRLTVEFQNLTKYGVPRFPRAKVLRDYE